MCLIALMLRSLRPHPFVREQKLNRQNAGLIFGCGVWATREFISNYVFPDCNTLFAFSSFSRSLLHIELLHQQHHFYP